MIAFIKQGLRDAAVSYLGQVGHPGAFDPKHTMYVWVDALSNISPRWATATRPTRLPGKFWPADLHMVGKGDPALHTILLACHADGSGFALPKRVFGHGGC